LLISGPQKTNFPRADPIGRCGSFAAIPCASLQASPPICRHVNGAHLLHVEQPRVQSIPDLRAENLGIARRRRELQ